MDYIPEDLAILCELLIQHYGREYVESWETLSELIELEFDLKVPPTILQAINLDMLEYLDTSINLRNCGVI